MEDKMARIAESSLIGRRLFSMPGYGHIVSAELAAEIATVERFSNQASLARYLGMATLDHSSGKSRGSRPPRHVNTRGPEAAMMIAVDHHRKPVPQSPRYHERKRAEGKTHNQAIHALGRHLYRVILKMLTQDRTYRIDP